MLPQRINHSFIQAIYIAPLQVRYYSESEVLPTQHGHCAGVSRRSTHIEWSNGPMTMEVIHSRTHRRQELMMMMMTTTTTMTMTMMSYHREIALHGYPFGLSAQPVERSVEVRSSSSSSESVAGTISKSSPHNCSVLSPAVQSC